MDEDELKKLLAGLPPVYILSADREVIEADFLTGMRWLQNPANVIVGRDTVGDYEICTDFLGHDLALWRPASPPRPPVVFECMVFSGFQRSGPIVACVRCATWAEAEEIHRGMVRKYREAVNG